MTVSEGMGQPPSLLDPGVIGAAETSQAEAAVSALLGDGAEPARAPGIGPVAARPAGRLAADGPDRRARHPVVPGNSSSSPGVGRVAGEGLNRVIERHRASAAATRAGVRELGLRPRIDEDAAAAAVVTTVAVPAGSSVAGIVASARAAG